MRPSTNKCTECDFNQICSKQREEFISGEIPPAIQIPLIENITAIAVRCLSDVD